ncbi:MAG: ATP-binding protein [Saezia sp.]
MAQSHSKAASRGAIGARAKLVETEKGAVCSKHGAYKAKGYQFCHDGEWAGKHATDKKEKVVWCGCPTCLQEDDEAKSKAAEGERLGREKAQLQERLQRSWLPQRFIGKTLETFVCSTAAQKRVLELVLAYVNDFEQNAAQGRGLIFLGGMGTGKSHLAAGVLQAVMASHQGLYMTVSDVVRAVRGTWRRDATCSEGEMLAKLVQVDVLVLDEVGRQYGTDGEEHILFDVLDGRYREMKPTILLGNITGDELAVYLGERVADRLRETNTAVVLDWESYRQKG